MQHDPARADALLAEIRDVILWPPTASYWQIAGPLTGLLDLMSVVGAVASAAQQAGDRRNTYYDIQRPHLLTSLRAQLLETAAVAIVTRLAIDVEQNLPSDDRVLWKPGGRCAP